MREKHITAIILTVTLLCGCNSSSTPSYMSSSEQLESSVTPFDNPTVSSAPDVPFITYLGNEDFEGTRTLELYQNQNANDSGETPITYIHVGENGLEDTLTEMLASDNSPDLCVKTENCIPYLASKNIFEDLTDYIDVSAPQWSGYSDFIREFKFNNAQYFYPTEIIISPQFLIYDCDRLTALGTDDPAALQEAGAWNIAALEKILKSAPTITGENAADNLFAAYGITLISKNNANKYLFSDSEKIKNAYEFISANVQAPNGNTTQKLINGSVSFLSGSEDTLAEIRRNNANFNAKIVPYPPETHSANNYKATAVGYLVPLGAKNIKGAASFINCSRIAAAENEKNNNFVNTAGLTSLDVDAINNMRSPNGKEPIVFDVFPLDPETNTALKGLYNDAIDSGNDWDELMLNYKPAIDKGLDRINSLSKR